MIQTEARARHESRRTRACFIRPELRSQTALRSFLLEQGWSPVRSPLAAARKVDASAYCTVTVIVVLAPTTRLVSEAPLAAVSVN